MEFQTKPNVNKQALQDEERHIEIWMVRSGSTLARWWPRKNVEQGLRMLRKKDVHKKAKAILASSQKVEKCWIETFGNAIWWVYFRPQYVCNNILWLKVQNCLVFVLWLRQNHNCPDIWLWGPANHKLPNCWTPNQHSIKTLVLELKSVLPLLEHSSCMMQNPNHATSTNWNNKSNKKLLWTNNWSVFCQFQTLQQKFSLRRRILTK